MPEHESSLDHWTFYTDSQHTYKLSEYYVLISYMIVNNHETHMINIKQFISIFILAYYTVYAYVSVLKWIQDVNDLQVRGGVKKGGIQKIKTPPRMWPLTLMFGLDIMPRSLKLSSLDVAYRIVSWYQVWCLWV